jgi:hypothetical protein
MNCLRDILAGRRLSAHALCSSVHDSRKWLCYFQGQRAARVATNAGENVERQSRNKMERK